MKTIRRLSRNIFKNAIGNRNKRRAISFAIFMKAVKPTSVVKDWTPKELSNLTHLDPRTCKKYVDLLREMQLVSEHTKEGHRYLVFEPLKEGKKKNKWNSGYHTSKYHNVMLGDYDTTSIKDIDIHLQALFICEVQRRKDYIQQIVSATQTPKSLRELKRAKRVCKDRGWNSFIDEGISFRYICKALNCSPNSVSKIIRYGERVGLFTVKRSEPEVVFFGIGRAREAAEYLDEKWSWCMNNVVVLQRANIFTLKDQKKPKKLKDPGTPRTHLALKR